MQINNSGAIYSLGLAVKYRLPELDNFTYDKKLDCYYSSGETRNFKRIFIDTELSPGYRFEVWRNGTYYCIELPILSYAVFTDKSNLDSINVDLKITTLKDNTYSEFTGSINDNKNLKLKTGLWSKKYILDYGKEVLDLHKEVVVDMLINEELESSDGVIRLFSDSFLQKNLFV